MTARKARFPAGSRDLENLQKCAVVPRRARIYGSQTILSPDSRLESNKNEEVGVISRSGREQHLLPPLGEHPVSGPSLGLRENNMQLCFHPSRYFHIFTKSCFQRGAFLCDRVHCQAMVAHNDDCVKSKGLPEWRRLWPSPARRTHPAPPPSTWAFVFFLG